MWEARSADGPWQFDKYGAQMETIALGLMIFSFIIVIAVDTAQKRRRFLAKGK